MKCMRATMFASRMVLLSALTSLAFCSPTDLPAEAIEGMKAYQQNLGLRPTGNFRVRTTKNVAEYRCYYAPVLELPGSYDHLRIKKGSAKGCPVKPGKDDVFFYPVEAVASGDMPVTAGLAGAPEERLMMVVMHEDLHQHHAGSRLPAPVTEAASTLLAFLTASDYAATRAPDGKAAAQQLARDAELFLHKARLVNRYVGRAAELYRAWKAGELSRTATLERKQRLFENLARECRASWGQAASFNSCPGALNNAGLAFDYTYTRHYPLLYALYEAERRNPRNTVRSLRELLAMPFRNEAQFVSALSARIARMAPAAGALGDID